MFIFDKFINDCITLNSELPAVYDVVVQLQVTLQLPSLFTVNVIVFEPVQLNHPVIFL